MKRAVLLAFLFLALPSVASAGWALVRGSGPQASFESTALPTVAVKASPDMRTVAQGRMGVDVTVDNTFIAPAYGQVWYCLSARDGAQLAVALADAGEGRQWRPGILGTNLAFLPVLYSSDSDKAGSVTQRVFLRPMQLDPWMPAFAAADMGWTASTMVSQYEWIAGEGEMKLLVEYREPCASEMTPVILPEELKAFIERANTAFSARFGSSGDIAAADVTPYPWGSHGVSARLLSTVLGTTMGDPS